MTEIWKDIEGYEGLYQVSNLGRIKSLERYRKTRSGGVTKIPEKEIVPHETNKGYLRAGLYKEGERTGFSVHRLVAKAFIPNIENKDTVNHINGNKHDNRVDNLEWNTYNENNKHALSSGLRGNPPSQKNNERSIPVAQYSKGMELIRIFPSMMEAERNGFSCCGISLCCKGVYKTHKGYIWKYAEGAAE